jgi:hypothetical protein
MLTKGPSGRLLAYVDRAGSQFLAGSGRAEDEDGRFRPRVVQLGTT